VTESLAAVRKLHDVVPGASFIALAVSETEDHIVAWAKAGVSGYVACDASAGELVTTITAVARGEAPCSPRMAAWLLKEVAALASAPDVEEADNRLTRREREIVELIERGLSNKEIARDLHIALSTVKNHVHNILDKLQVSRRSHVPRARSGHRFTTARNDSENVGMDPGN
jgi:two-component system nitrate/nitrite response regulator NarL